MFTQTFKWQNKAFKALDVRNVSLHYKCKYLLLLTLYLVLNFFFLILTLYQFGPVGFINQLIVFKKKRKELSKVKVTGLLGISKY